VTDWRFTPQDEDLHLVEPGQLWGESYYYDFVSADASLAGYVRIGLYPNWGRAWYWACVVGPDRPTVMLVDNLGTLPTGSPRDGSGSMSFAGGGYEGKQEILEAGNSVRVALDAGEFGLDLTWRTVGGVYPYGNTTRYEVPCEVAGELVVDGRRSACTGFGERDHSWGERDWWSMSWLWAAGRTGAGSAFHVVQPNLGLAFDWPGFICTPDGVLQPREGSCASTVFDGDGVPVRSRITVGDLETEAVPVAFAPVDLVSPDGRTATFRRALCRFSTPGARDGFGWVEWNQPPGWEQHDWNPSPRLIPT
jgi:hypothetical protein